MASPPVLGYILMQIVPFSAPGQPQAAPTQPPPAPVFQLMAAVQMHNEGRLLAPNTTPTTTTAEPLPNG